MDSSPLTFYGKTQEEQQKNLADIITQSCKNALGKQDIVIHNYYICQKDCDISDEDKITMVKHKNFQHKWLFDPTLSCCTQTHIWSLCYVEGKGMFCALCQMHDGAHPQSKDTTWNKHPNVRYRPETIRGHMNKDPNSKETMHSNSASKELMKYTSFFVKESQNSEKTLNASYEKVFTSLYWLCKEEIAVSKAVSLFQLEEMLGVEDIDSFTTRSPATIRNMILVLAEIVKNKLVAKIKKSDGYACLIDEVTDISNIQNLLTFIRYFDFEKGTTSTCFGSTCDVLEESKTTSADAVSIFESLKNTLEKDLDLELKDLIGFCSDGASVMTGKDNGVAAKLKQLPECATLLSIHCICHRLALACGDAGDSLLSFLNLRQT